MADHDEPKWHRLSFQEAMELSRLPDRTDGAGKTIQRFMSHRPAWKLGEELPRNVPLGDMAASVERFPGPGSYGGVVYTMSALAAARVVEEKDKEAALENKFAIHSIQGVFTNPGYKYKPYIFDVSEVTSSRSFYTLFVTVRQTLHTSPNAAAGRFETSEADSELSEICFTSLVTLKRPFQGGPADIQNPSSVQERYSDILASRAPTEWPVCPQGDVDMLTSLFPDAGPGAFPILDMHKVDMTEFNANKTLVDKRQLLLYRPLKPLPTDDFSAHIATHAFEADRNGLLMLMNNVGWGWHYGFAATLSYSFYLHVNPSEAVMRGDGWWVHEGSFTRVGAGRGMLEMKLWSPEGKHVASAYQDGVVLPQRKSQEKEKL